MFHNKIKTKLDFINFSVTHHSNLSKIKFQDLSKIKKTF